MLRHLEDDEKWWADSAYQAPGGLGKYALSAMLNCCWCLFLCLPSSAHFCYICRAKRQQWPKWPIEQHARLYWVLNQWRRTGQPIHRQGSCWGQGGKCHSGPIHWGWMGQEWLPKSMAMEGTMVWDPARWQRNKGGKCYSSYFKCLTALWHLEQLICVFPAFFSPHTEGSRTWRDRKAGLGYAFEIMKVRTIIRWLISFTFIKFIQYPYSTFVFYPFIVHLPILGLFNVQLACT